LNNFYIIAGCIIWWQQSKFGTCCTTKGFNDSIKFFLRVSVCNYLHPLAYRKFRNLRFLKIGDDPDVIRQREGHQRCTDLNKLAFFDGLLRYVAILGRVDLCVGKIAFGLIDRRLCGTDPSKLVGNANPTRYLSLHISADFSRTLSDLAAERNMSRDSFIRVVLAITVGRLTGRTMDDVLTGMPPQRKYRSRSEAHLPSKPEGRPRKQPA